MAFFQQFPKIQYDLQETNDFTERVDIYRHVDVDTIRSDDFTTYLYYNIQEGERPDIVSQKLYRTPDYYWTFFIINDFLQSGFNEWYKSYIDFHRGIEQEYGDHGAFIFLPNLATSLSEISSALDSPLNSPQNDYTRNMMNGLDLNYDYLRFLKTGTSPESTAKIERYDNFLLQLVTYDASDVNFYNTNGIYQFAFSSDATETQKSSWLEIYTNYLKSINAITADVDTLTESDLSTYTYRPYRAYDELVNAPHGFESTDSPFVYIGAYDALHPNRALGNISNIQTWFEYEQEKNEARRRIRYVRPEFVEAFVEEYQNLINS